MGAEAAERARLVEEFKQRKREAAENRARGINDFQPPVCPKLNYSTLFHIVSLFLGMLGMPYNQECGEGIEPIVQREV